MGTRGQDSRREATPGHRGGGIAAPMVAVAIGLLAAVGAGLAAQAVAGGFRFDWYVHPPQPAIAAGTAAAAAAGLAALAALLAAPLGVSLAYRRSDRSNRPTQAPTPGTPLRRRDVHLLAATLLATGIAAALAGLAAWLLAARAPLRPAAFVPFVAAATGLLTAAALLLPHRATARALAAGRLAPAVRGDNLIGHAMVLASRRPSAVLAAVLATTAVAAYGLTLVTTNVDVADVLPRGDPNTDAAHNLTAEFKSSFTQQVTFHVRVDPAKHGRDEAGHLPRRLTDPQPGNISDEVYVRAIDQMVDFLKAYVPEGHTEPPFVGAVTLPSFYRLVNWTMAGGVNGTWDAYALPPATDPQGALRYRMVEEGVWRLIPDAADTLVSPDLKQAATLLTVDPATPLSSREIGEIAIKAREAYVLWATDDPEAYKVFTGDNAPLFTVDLPLANAHQSRLTEEDFSILGPAIAGFIALCLWFAFWDARAILIAFTSLVISVVWTFGAMGFMGIPMNPLNLTVVPLVMGVGIDYGIHVLNDFREERSRGKRAEEAFRSTGNRAGLSLFIATLTSIAGLAVMVVSPSLLIAQLGLLSCIALASSYLLTIAYGPALLALLDVKEGPRQYRPSPLMASAARGVSRYRGLIAVALVGLSGAAYASSLALTTEPFGDPPRNWLPDDPLRAEHERAGRGFYATDKPDAKANVLVFEGDIIDPAAHRYMDALESSLAEKPRIINDTLRTVPFLVRTYLAVRDGLPGAAQYTLLDRLSGIVPAEAATPYPRTRGELQALMEEVHRTPLYEFANLFFDYPNPQMAIMTFTARAESYEDAVEVWNQVWAAVEENENLRPEGLRVAFVGNTATNYLFVAKEVPWLNYMSIAVSILVVAVVFAVTRDVKATLVVGLHNLLTGLLWIGLLPLLGVGLSIALTLPLIFIFSMGSDYGLHLCLACRDIGDTARVFEVTGKAILYSFLTTFGAFLIFTQVSNLAIQRTMIATAAAVVVIFVATVLLIPIFYPAKPQERSLRPAVVTASSASPEPQEVPPHLRR